ncbi:PREDICTED: odorant receptor 30a-like, partial [Habropoda laboriosa]|uniref:odorant receptor 30a-like n=1 Tax=Habropoda laboriosa TaxID=597456 RepID=UPI00083CD1FF
NLFSGLLIHIYCQFEILQHRLKSIKPDREYSAKQCAFHHYRIYKFAEIINAKFSITMATQFLVTTMTMCFNLFRLTQTKVYSQVLALIPFMVSVFAQIFYCCWYGNETKVKSLEICDTVFESNWTALSQSTKKTLLTIMLRSLKPIEFTGAFVFPVNLESFKSLVKTSYSVFNVIQQT